VQLAIALKLLALVLLLGLSAFFSSSETSLFSLDNNALGRMRRERHPRVELITRLLSEPRRLIVTILIGNELVNVAASVLSVSVLVDVFGAGSEWLNLVVMVPLLLIFGEITPKTLAIRNNVAFAAFQSRHIARFARLITPVRWIVRRVADLFTTIVVGRARTRASLVTEDMVRSLAEEAVGEGALDRDEVGYIRRIFEFGDTRLCDVMTPIDGLFALPATLTPAELIAAVAASGRTKVPIMGDDDAILGVLFARDLLGVSRQERALDALSDTGLPGLLHAPVFVGRQVLVAELFRRFRRERLSIAFVRDADHRTVGVVTREDLLRCIFGDLPDDPDGPIPGAPRAALPVTLKEQP